MKRRHTIFLLLVFGSLIQALAASPAFSAPLNRPYADLKAWRLGFSVGLHMQDLAFTHNGEPQGAEGGAWYIQQPSYSPGFCVSALASLRLNSFFSLRFSPGLYFGSRNLEMLNTATGATEHQDLKSTFIVAPVDLQYHAVRLRNFRPYMAAGIMPVFDVTKRRGELIQLKSSDVYLTVALGADFYLKYFKFIPEVKFCFGLCDVLQRNRPDLDEDLNKLQFTRALKRASSRMVVLTFYFE